MSKASPSSSLRNAKKNAEILVLRQLLINAQILRKSDNPMIAEAARKQVELLAGQIDLVEATKSEIVHGTSVAVTPSTLEEIESLPEGTTVEVLTPKTAKAITNLYYGKGEIKGVEQVLHGLAQLMFRKAPRLRPLA